MLPLTFCPETKDRAPVPPLPHPLIPGPYPLLDFYRYGALPFISLSTLPLVVHTPRSAKRVATVR